MNIICRMKKMKKFDIFEMKFVVTLRKIPISEIYIIP